MDDNGDLAQLLKTAELHERAQEWVQADAVYRQVLRERPDHFDAWFRRGQVAHVQGRRFDAVECFQKAWRLQPSNPEPWTMLGVAFAQIGQHKDAEACLRDVLRSHPEFVKAHLNLGVSLAEQKRFDEALTCFQTAIRLQPDYAEAHHNLGTTLMHLRRPDEAIAVLRHVLTLKPDHADALTNLGLVLAQKRKSEEASVLLKQAIRLRPASVEAHNNLGMACTEMGRWDEAEAALEQALRLNPHHVEGHVNLGNLYRDLGRLEESLACYDHVLRMSPDLPSARWNRSLVLLQMGNFEEGWKEYEWRWKRGQPPRTFPQPMWDGSSLEGKTILVHMEQGLGDMIMFIRYAKLLKERGATVIVECPAKMIPLFSTNKHIDQLVAEETPLPDFDVHSPLMSLPYLCGTTLKTIPADVPYLFPDPKLVEHWGKVLEAYPGFRIGLCWQGNPNHSHDRHRSIPLREFAPLLAKIPNAQLISLQQGAGVEQMEEMRRTMPIVQLPNAADDDNAAFLNTAAIMHHLNAIVSIDTSVMHLAGALSRPTFLILPKISDWRWLRNRSTSAWYPTLRVLRNQVCRERIAALLHPEI